MDGLLEAKSEPKWKFLLRAVHAARVSKLWSVYWGRGGHTCACIIGTEHVLITSSGDPVLLRPTIRPTAS